MKKLLTLTAVSVFALLVVSAPLAYSQEKGAPQPPSQAPSQAVEKTFEGQLTKVDANAKSISVQGAAGPEMTFMYTEQTQVLGSEKTVQGLAGKTGTQLRITYREAGASKAATRIEIVEKEK